MHVPSKTMNHNGGQAMAGTENIVERSGGNDSRSGNWNVSLVDDVGELVASPSE